MNRIVTLLLVSALISGLPSCSKDPDNPTPDVDPTKPPVDPETAKTIGFFLDGWQSRSFSVPGNTEDKTVADPQVTISIDPYKIKTKIPALLAGENANVITTQFVNETGLMTNINALHPSLIRFPGGDQTSLFFWDRAAGSLPADVPAQLVDKDGTAYTPSYYYGKSTASNTLSLDNYYQMLSQTGAKGIIAVNAAYARYSTADNPVAAAGKLAADWVRYDNGRTKYWEVGNENYGNWQAGYRIATANNKDGQPEIINGDLYGDQVNVIIDSMRKAATEIGKSIYISAVLVEGQYTSSTPTEIDWNVKVIKKVNSKVDFYSLHNDYTPFGEDPNASYILYSPASSTKDMSNYVNAAFKSAGVDAKPLALTDYGINAIGRQQQSSFVGGMHTIAVINESLNNNIGVTIHDGLASWWNNGNSPGMFGLGDAGSSLDKGSPRPGFYYKWFANRFMGDRAITASISDGTAELLLYSTSFSNNYVGLVIENQSENAVTAKVDLKYWNKGNQAYWYVLEGGTDNGEFSQKVIINGQGPTGNAGGPANYSTIPAYVSPATDGVVVSIPKRGTVMVAIPYTMPQ
ncbi:hypothetical protein [Flavihumibacter petaseus]|uniref:Alpha-L-arabinofuranosidase 1 catalytic domain-containing protein n=1 Tax=Flavihumibacter petaseus NBRC 106054 TaxID=1220578 RepID=A0A0E9N3T1_9BACT|nr:hypothetical protein [Flavihumibacter petaseus]GAO44341.1 hypothetical protein FPE01S_03_03790 [Flavihumibacter petaseus NBRC 106054]